MMKKFIYILLLAAGFVSKTQSQPAHFFEIARMPFSSDRSDEFAPAYYKDGLVFTANIRTSAIISRLTEEGDVLFNIYFTGIKQSDKWEKPDILDKSLKSNYHDGPVSFSPDGSKVYFTRNIPARGDKPSTLGIFIAEYSGNEWINITGFPFNSNNYNISHPSISDDGRTLYFASDMPGGKGGMDIYSSELQGLAWMAPENLGDNINSPKDEVFPYIHSGGRLYFSTDNNDNGDFDLHYSIISSMGSWQNPIRLSEPFNTSADDFAFIASPELDTGYFSSNREGSDDIYSFVSTFPVFTDCETIKEPGLCFDFFEASGGDVDTATHYFEWDMGDGSLIRGKEVEYCFAETGTYLVHLNVIDMLTGEVSSNIVSHELHLTKPVQPYITSPDTCIINEHITIDALETNLGNLEVDEFYWDLGDGTRTTGEKITHKFDRPGVYEISLGVLTDPDSPYGQQKICVYKNITVLEATHDNHLPATISE